MRGSVSHAGVLRSRDTLASVAARRGAGVSKMPRLCPNLQALSAKLAAVSRPRTPVIYSARAASAYAGKVSRGRAVHRRMGILQGLLDKVGLGHVLAPREPLRVFLLDDDVLRHEWFAKQ